MGSRTLRAAVPALVVLALVAIVAIASGGSTSLGSADGRPPANTVVDTILSIGLVALIPAAAMLIYGLTQREAIRREITTKKFRRLSFPMFIALIVLFTAAMSYLLHIYEPREFAGEFGELALPERGTAAETDLAGGRNLRDPQFAWIPVLTIVGLVGAVIVGLMLAERRRRPTPLPSDGEVAAQIAEEVEVGLDDLRAEPDPRRAVIAAYARLERALAASGLPRRPHETAEEYVARILGRLEVSRRLVRRLTDLFTRAKFSQHMVDVAMKEEAIAALAEIRDQLRAVAERRLEESARATAEPERAAVT